MKFLLSALAGFLFLSIVSLGQPMPTMGVAKEKHLTCPACFVESRVQIRKSVITKRIWEMGGTKLFRTYSVVCPKCDLITVAKDTLWIPDPYDVPARPKIDIPPPLPQKTNALGLTPDSLP